MEKALLLKNLESGLADLKTIPLWGTSPQFPWQSFAEDLTHSLDLKDLSVSHHNTQWLKSQDLTTGMGDNPSIQALTLSPIPGALFWIMPQKSRETLIQLLLSKEEKSKGFSDSVLQEGFYHFVLLNVLKTFNRKGVYGNLVASLTDETELPEEGALAIDVSIKTSHSQLWGRLLVPRQTQESFSSYFAMSNPPLLEGPSFNDLPVDMQVLIGNTTLFASQWKKVKSGDFILLDRCSYDLNNRRGTASLTVGITPLFEVRIKDSEVKILEYALFQEEKPMTIEDDDLSKMDEAPEEHLWAAEGSHEKTEDLLSSAQIPLTLTVEVSRIKMPLSQVTKLKPGNVLDLHLAPLPNVHLTIGGKRVAKGELVQLGETLGVKILGIG